MTLRTAKATGNRVDLDAHAIVCADEAAARRLAGHLTFLGWIKSLDVDGHVSIEAAMLTTERLRAVDVPRHGREPLRRALIALTNSHDFAAAVVD